MRESRDSPWRAGIIAMIYECHDDAILQPATARRRLHFHTVPMEAAIAADDARADILQPTRTIRRHAHLRCRQK